MTEKIAQVTLTPEDACVIEASIHTAWENDSELGNFEWLTCRLAGIVVSGMPHVVPMTLPDVFDLRRVVNPQVVIGKTTGMDVIYKLFEAIVRLEPVYPDFSGTVFQSENQTEAEVGAVVVG